MKQRKKWATMVAGLLALSLVGAACANDEDTSASDTGTTEPAPGGEVDCATVEFGCVEVASGEPIQLGTLLAISGDVASLGLDSQAGAELAVDYLDGAFDGTMGQVLGHDIEWQHEDDGCSAEGGQAGGTALSTNESLVAVVGTSCSSSALGVADKILGDLGIPLISPSNTAPTLTDPTAHNPFYLRIAHNDRIQGAIVAEFVYNELGLMSAATIQDESPYTAGLAAAFKENFEALGGTITGQEQINSGDKDFKATLNSLAPGDPEAVYAPDFNPACALIAKQAADILPDATLLGSDGCLATDFLDIAGSAAAGFWASSPDVTAFQEGEFYTDEFLPAYKEAVGTEPTSVFHLHAFDSANVIFNAIEQVAIENEDGSLSIPRMALKDALFATEGFAGATGTITCLDTGDCASAVTIGLYEAPNWPVEGGEGDGAPTYSATKSLADVA